VNNHIRLRLRLWLLAVALLVALGPGRAQGADPVVASGTLYNMGGNVSGIGVLASYNSPGPGSVVVTRSTTLVAAGQLPPITLIKVVDPTGHIACWSDITNQATAQTSVTLTIPAGPAGIWRVSVQGGLTGDGVTITLPASTAWGVRGEMALGLLPNTGLSGWLWIPPGAGNVLMEAETGGTITVTTAGGVTLPGTACRSGVWRWTTLPQGAAVQDTVSSAAQAFVVDGAPGLLCADPTTAQTLAGGTSIVDGRVVDGPLQARAVAWMQQAVLTNLAPGLTFPSSVPPNQSDAMAAIQLYGEYAPLSGLAAACAAQLLDPSQPTCGSFLGPIDTTTLHGGDVDPYDCAGLAAAVTANVSDNPAYGNPALIRRAMLLACYHIANLQGDDLIRESDISVSDYPMSLSFFDYLGSIALPYNLLKAQLATFDPTASAILGDAVIAVSDRLADYHGYESNQFWHMVLSQIYANLGTGEARYRTWFERHVTEMLGNDAVPNRQIGQDVAGYFIEAFGPDGNYDAISDTCLSDALHTYATVASPDPAILSLMQSGLALDLGFTSCHWLPQPDGTVLGPTATMTRQAHSFADQAWPGTRLARDQFPLAAAHWLLQAVPPTGTGIAGVFPYRVCTTAWAQSALAKQVPLGDTLLTINGLGVQAPWTAMAIGETSATVQTPATIPANSAAGSWSLPGQMAWKQGDLYGLCFYDAVDQTNLAAPCRTGGAPSALWTAATGAVVLSSHDTHYSDALGNNGVATTNDLTHACIYGTHAGSLWWSGRERCALTTMSATSFKIAGAAVAAPSAPVSWTYSYGPGFLELDVAVTLSDLSQATLNLPFVLEDASAQLTSTAAGSAVFRAGSGQVTMTYAGSSATITPALTTGVSGTAAYPVTCLRIPLVEHGTTWNGSVVFSTAAGDTYLAQHPGAVDSGSASDGTANGATGSGAVGSGGGGGSGCGFGSGVATLLITTALLLGRQLRSRQRQRA